MPVLATLPTPAEVLDQNLFKNNGEKHESGRPLSAASRLRALLLRRLRLPLPLARATCRCRHFLDSYGDHRAACSTAGALGRRGVPLEVAAARIGQAHVQCPGLLRQDNEKYIILDAL